MAQSAEFDNPRDAWDARYRTDEYILGWEVLLLRDYEEVLDEGPKHHGMAAPVDLGARKSA